MMDQDVSVLAARLQSLHKDVGEIKSALGSLTEAITKLALIEERQTVTNNALERAFVALEKLEHRIGTLEKEAPLNNKSNIWVDRIIMLIVGGFLVAAWEAIKRN
jgi:regulator of replication initiation timing